MKILDPGHTYELQTIDTPDGYFDGQTWNQHFEGVNQILIFVKRVGDVYPGNEDAYPGTIMQDVIRVLIDRLDHVNAQAYDPRNDLVRQYLVGAFYWLENRAADKHGLLTQLPTDHDVVLKLPSCLTCGHVICEHEKDTS